MKYPLQIHIEYAIPHLLIEIEKRSPWKDPGIVD
jgi:hypothetical protein